MVDLWAFPLFSGVVTAEWVGKRQARRLTVGVAATALAGMALATAMATPAAAGPNSSPSGEITPIVDQGQPRVTVSYTGDVGSSSGGNGGRGPVTSIPATCWWETIPVDINLGDPPVDAGDPESVEKYFNEIMPLLSGHAAAGRLALPSGEDIKDAIRRELAGEDMTWYTVDCIEGGDAIKTGITRKGGSFDGVDIALAFQAFPAGDGPPVEAGVEAQQLAFFAQQAMEIDEPEIDRNPKIAAVDNATLLGMDTRFWVTNPDPALGEDGVKEVTATAGPVTATVTGTTDGLHVTTSGGVAKPSSATCPPTLAAQAHVPGAAIPEECRLVFTRASVGSAGHAVRAETVWDLNWQGQEGDGTPVANTPPLPDVPVGADFQIPVAESQAIVTRGD